MKLIETPYGKLSYQVIGNGPSNAVVFAGMGLSNEYYQDLATSLGPTLTTFLFDHPGIKDSSSSWELSSTRVADEIFYALDKLEINQAHLIGESYGGMLAAQVCIDHPAVAASLTMINSSAGGFLSPRLSFPGAIRVLRSGIEKNNLAQLTIKNIFSPKTLTHNPDLISKWLHMYERNKIDVFNTSKQLVAAARFGSKSDLKNIQVPTLVVYGEDDQMVPVQNSFNLHRTIAGSKIIKVENGGHHLCFEKVPELSEIIVDFINP